MEYSRGNKKRNNLRTNILTIAINDLISNGLISLDYDPVTNEAEDCDRNMYTKVIQLDDLTLFVRYHHIGFGEIRISVGGIVLEDTDDIDDDLPEYCVKDAHFHVAGYLERKSGKFRSNSLGPRRLGRSQVVN